MTKIDEKVDNRTSGELCHRVGVWSQNNFGKQHTDQFGIHILDNGEMMVELNEFAPLLGIVEELGEFSKAVRQGIVKDIADSLGDIGIYMADYCHRAQIQLPLSAAQVKHSIEVSKVFKPCEIVKGEAIGLLAEAIGELYHCHLKRLQNIKGFEDYMMFLERRWAAVQKVAVALHCAWNFVSEIHPELEDFASSSLQMSVITFNKVVSKRDFTKAADGGDHNH